MNKKRTLIILILIVLLPLGLLSWQSIKIAKNEQQVAKARFDQLLDTQLNQIDRDIHRYFEEQANRWISELPRWSLDEKFLREQVKRSPHIRQIFLLDQSKKRVFPEESSQLTQDEKQLTQRLQSLWNDPDRLFVNDQQSAENSELESSEFISKSRSKIAKSASYYGWYRWHWESGASIIFWWKAPSGRTVGLELESSRIMADIIALLPSTSRKNDESDSRVRLLNDQGHIVYQWGLFESEKSEPLSSRALKYPLSNWMLEYFGKTPKQTTSGLLNLMLILAVFALTLIGLVTYLYREHTREIRMASQQVHFVSQVSHELKTPLTNIRMYAEMLEQTLDDDPQPQKYSKIIIDESQRLTRLITNVLSFSRTPRLHQQTFNPSELILKITDSFKPSFQSKSLEINLDLAPNIQLKTDPDLLEQIINNLLSNVEKYAHSGKQVDIHSRVDQGNYIVSVRDYGEEIPAKDRQNIFKAFYRLNNRLTEGVSGTGIGLTISRQQAERLGGSLELVSVSPGSCFELRIPYDTTN